MFWFQVMSPTCDSRARVWNILAFWNRICFSFITCSVVLLMLSFRQFVAAPCDKSPHQSSLLLQAVFRGTLPWSVPVLFVTSSDMLPSTLPYCIPGQRGGIVKIINQTLHQNCCWCCAYCCKSSAFREVLALNCGSILMMGWILRMHSLHQQIRTDPAAVEMNVCVMLQQWRCRNERMLPGWDVRMSCLSLLGVLTIDTLVCCGNSVEKGRRSSAANPAGEPWQDTFLWSEPQQAGGLWHQQWCVTCT